MTSQIHVTFLDRYQQILINGLDPGAAVQLLNKLVHVNGSMSSKLVDLIGYCPLTIKVVAALLRKPGMEGGAWLLSELERSGISSSCLDHTLAVNTCWKAVMDIAYSRLDAKGKECGHLVSYFPGSFDEVAVENILLKQYNCQSRLVDASLLKIYTHMNSEMVRYTMHNLIRDYFRRINIQTSDIQQRFSALFQDHYSNLVLNISYVILQAGPSSADDYFQIESHNWKELVNKTKLSGKISDDLLLSISFIHYKHVLPLNAPWLDIFMTYNKPQFSVVCETFGRTICSKILLDTVKNIYEIKSPLSCSILRIIENVTEENENIQLLSESLCYCNTQINIIYYFVTMPYIALIVVSVLHIIVNIFTFNIILNEIYYHIIDLLRYFIPFSVTLLHVSIHHVSKLLCRSVCYIDNPKEIFIILFLILSIYIFLILHGHIIPPTDELYHNPYLITIIFSCGSLPIFFFVIDNFSTDKYYQLFYWRDFVHFYVGLYSLLDIKEGNSMIKNLYNTIFGFRKCEQLTFPFILYIITLHLIVVIYGYYLLPFMHFIW